MGTLGMEKLLELETRELTETVERIEGVVVGMLFAIDEDGKPKVMFSGNPASGPAAALTTIALTSEDIGKEVALLFENNDPTKPMIIGRMVRPGSNPVEVELDNEIQDLDLSADRQIKLKCGKASITLQADGKVLIRGTYLSSRSSGPNRIKGGSVHLN